MFKQKISLRRVALISLLLFKTSISLAADETSGCAIAGTKDAPIIIQEFVDFQCSYCANGSKTLERVLEKNPGKIKVILRNSPLEFHPQAQAAAQAFVAVCQQSTEKAHEFQKRLFSSQEELGKEGQKFLFKTAQDLQIDMERFEKDFRSKKTARIIQFDQALAEEHQFRGTPSFLIGNEELVGARDENEFQKIIDRQLQLINR